MGRHGRNNTSRADFTYAERQMAQGGTKRALLGREAMKDIDACSLCLQHARDPRVCSEGHLYCQECILTSLLDQKKDIKRQQKLLERMRAESEAEMATARAAARERVLKEFETAQSSLGSKTTQGKVSATGADEEKVGPRGTKRTFELDEDEIDRLTKEATDEALNRTAREMADARRAKLPNFWLPSLTPTATPESIIDTKLQTLCHASRPPHPVSLKTLVTVKLTEDPEEKNRSGNPTVLCPSCRKTITNNVKVFALKACGDVLCSTCVDTLCRTDKVCAHCTTPVDKKLPYIELKREGTGYAAGGGVQVEKFDVAFQA
ncbi:zinc finger protein, nitric oxide synthase-interacting protein [Rhodotorula toruloides]|uniref:Nitric oxide synthase-interacting protein zinc-finger domain-containing protein n=1 Tax=Rhodotorula toruloides TaxID=5286 RepID=A0A0K3C7T4_RHOTO|nr:zinc finger protein, nitric oxide synthase-interacting protein [Rhodotorula toruloides]